MLAAQIQNLQPVVPPKAATTNIGPGDKWSSSDPLEIEVPYSLDDQERDQQDVEFACLEVWGQILASILADAVSVDVSPLDTQVMVSSVASTVDVQQRAETSVRALGETDADTSTSSPGARVDYGDADVTVVVDDDDDT